MKLHVCLASVIVASAVQAADTDQSTVLSTNSGLISFVAGTNIPGIDVAGKSKVMTASVLVSRGGSGLVLKQIETSLPVASLSTGMNLRDEHMRKHVFTTADGKTPDVHFQAANGACEGSQEKTCNFTGEMSLRGVTHVVPITLHVKDGQGGAFHAKGDITIKLSDFGIERPSQLGVTVADDVRVHVEFAMKAGGEAR